MLAEYMVSIDINHPQEQTLKYWLAMLVRLHFGDRFPSYQSIFEMLLDLKHAIESSRKKPRFPPLSRYPNTPRELPQHVFNEFFKDEPPTSITIDRFTQTANHHIPLRKNSKLLTKSNRAQSSADIAITDATSSPCDDIDVAHAPAWVRHLVKLAANGGAYTDDVEQRRPTPTLRPPLCLQMKPKGAIGLRTDPPRPSSSIPLALTDGAVHRADEPAQLADEPHEPPAPEEPPAKVRKVESAYIGDVLALPASADAPAVISRDIEAYEADTIQRLQARNTRKAAEAKERLLKRPAASVAAESDPRLMLLERILEAQLLKRPAASDAAGAEEQLLKRPAASDAAGAEEQLLKRPAASVCKRPAAAGRKSGPKPQYMAGARPAVPPIGSPSIAYNGGTIYVSAAKKCFRIIRVAGDFNTEIRRTWHGEAPCPDAWQKALNAIDATRAAEP